MKNALIQAQQLNDTIRQSAEYYNYQETKARLAQNETLYRNLNEFRRKNYELQNREGDENRYDEVCALVHEYQEILHDSFVSEFLLAEQRMCNMLQEVYEIINADLIFDYDYLEK